MNAPVLIRWVLMRFDLGMNTGRAIPSSAGIWIHVPGCFALRVTCSRSGGTWLVE